VEGQSDPGNVNDVNDGAPVPASGRRPLGDPMATKSFEAKQKTQFDAKGKKIFDGYAPGQSFRKKTSAEIAGEVRQAAQEAPEAIEQQRIPKPARDMAKGYFRNLGDPKSAEPKGEAKP
jgi:hypothetical protein